MVEKNHFFDNAFEVDCIMQLEQLNEFGGVSELLVHQTVVDVLNH